MTHPLCHARKIITETPNGPRIPIGALFAAMTGEEINQWFRQGTNELQCDDGGILPDGVERFLSSLSVHESIGSRVPSTPHRS